MSFGWKKYSPQSRFHNEFLFYAKCFLRNIFCFSLVKYFLVISFDTEIFGHYIFRTKRILDNKVFRRLNVILEEELQNCAWRMKPDNVNFQLI